MTNPPYIPEEALKAAAKRHYEIIVCSGCSHIIDATYEYRHDGHGPAEEVEVIPAPEGSGLDVQ